MNYERQIKNLSLERAKAKQSDMHYFELKTESGDIIRIPKKVVIKALSSSIEHFESRLKYQQSNPEE